MLLAVLTSQFLSVSSSRDSSMWLAGAVALGLEVRLDYTFCCSRAKLLISRWPGSKRGEKGYGDKTCSSKTPRELCPSLQLTSISPLSYQQINLVFKVSTLMIRSYLNCTFSCGPNFQHMIFWGIFCIQTTGGIL